MRLKEKENARKRGQKEEAGSEIQFFLREAFRRHHATLVRMEDILPPPRSYPPGRDGTPLPSVDLSLHPLRPHECLPSSPSSPTTISHHKCRELGQINSPTTTAARISPTSAPPAPHRARRSRSTRCRAYDNRCR